MNYDLLSKENIDYAVSFIDKRIKMADMNERPLLYGERQMLHIAKKALLKLQQDNEAHNCPTKPLDIEKMTGKKQ